MMDDGALIDPDLGCTNPLILCESGCIDYEGVRNFSARGDFVSGNAQHDVGLPELPAAVFLFRLRAVNPGAFRGALIHPCDDLVDFSGRKRSIVLEFQCRTFIGMPWRHGPANYRFPNSLGPWASIRVIRKSHRANFTFLMTRLATCAEDRIHVREGLRSREYRENKGKNDSLMQWQLCQT